MIIGQGSLARRWVEVGAGGYSGIEDWSHPSLAAGPGGGLVTFDQPRQAIVTLDPAGVVERRLPVAIGAGHGLWSDPDGSSTWIADPGVDNLVRDGLITRSERVGSVRLFDASGRETARIETPDHEAYEARPFRPTSIVRVSGSAVDDASLWVADGYGGHVVHRYSIAGVHQGAVDGRETGRHFDCPHAVVVDERTTPARVLIADRGNARIVAYAVSGAFLGSFGDEHLTTPSGFALVGDLLVVAELRGRLTVFDQDDRFVGHLGGGAPSTDPAWPNVRLGERIVAPPTRPGSFNSPHGIAALPDGSIVVAEWVIGGRLVRLAPLD